MNLLRSLARGGAVLAACVAVAAHAGVVVKSSGPSAAQYPVGKKLDDMATITLRAGDSLTVLTDAGTRVLVGPGTHRVGARGETKATAFAMLTRQRAGARVRTGAVRGTGSATPATNASLWNVDLSQGGKVCLLDSDTIEFWRPVAQGAKTYMLKSNTSEFHIHVAFADGDATTTMQAEQLPLDSHKSYTFSSAEDSAARPLEFVILAKAPSDAEAMAVALAENGCSGQLDLLATRLAAN